MLVLITGVGNVGKSAFRRHLAKVLRAYRYTVLEADTDGFALNRNPQDADMIEITPTSSFSNKAIYVVEDVNALEIDALLPITAYDLIFYVSADRNSHLRFWVGRGWNWFRNGIYDWQRKFGLTGTSRRYDPRNIPVIISSIWENVRQRSLILSDQQRLGQLKSSTVFVSAQYSKRGPVFTEPLLNYFDDSLRRT